MPLYQDTRRFFAACAADLEELLAGELAELGARECRITRRGVHFLADDAALFRAVLESALASRILAPLSSFDCHSAKYLHRRVEDLPWEELLGPEDTLLISATLSNSRLRHTRYAAQVVKDGICDRLRRLEGRRPSVERHEPSVRIHLHSQGNKATLSWDCSDGAMHRRGYRLESGAAPLSETVAAAILRLSGWRGDEPLLDPFCGSGTLLAEAAFRATGVGVGTLRERFGVRSLPGVDVEDFDRRLREHRQASAEISPGRLRGGDVDAAMIERARQNLFRVPGAKTVELRATDFRDDAGLENGCIVCNPPFGLRLGRGDEAARLMKDFGDWLKQRCQGSTAWIYLGRRELAKHIGLRPARRIPLRSGGLDGRLLRYELF